MYVISNLFYSYPDAVLEPPMFAEKRSEIAPTIVHKIKSDLWEMKDSDPTFDPHKMNYEKFLTVQTFDGIETYQIPNLTSKAFENHDVRNADQIGFALMTENANEKDEIAWNFLISEVPKEAKN